MTANNYDNIDDLLVKVVLQEASPEEELIVRQWTDSSPDNARYFDDLRKIWDQSRKLAVQSTVSEEDAWQDFQRRIGRPAGERDTGIVTHTASANDTGIVKDIGIATDTGILKDTEMVTDTGIATDDPEQAGGKSVRMGGWRRWLQVAALIAVLAGGIWLYQRSTGGQEQQVAIYASKQALTDTLSEGTIVTLNQASSIKYKDHFSKDSRKVELNGEAFFAVSPDKDRPFIVQAKDVSVKVLGTSFNVKMKGGSVEVIVETGMVEVVKNGHAVTLRANERTLITGDSMSLVKEDNQDRLYNYYRTGEFDCNGTPLWRLVEKLNEVYKANIVIGDPQLRNMPMTVTFRQESLDTMLDVITRTFKLTMERKGDEIILK